MNNDEWVQFEASKLGIAGRVLEKEDTQEEILTYLHHRYAWWADVIPRS